MRLRRRHFLFGSAAALGGLVVGYRAWDDSYARQARTLTERKGETLLAGWVKIGVDDRITVYIPHVDMGQGTHTALAMMLAEELDADWSKVAAEHAPAENAFANGFLAKAWVFQNRTSPAALDPLVDATFTQIARFIDLQLTGGSTAIRMTGQLGLRTVGAAARQMLVAAAARRWNVDAATLSTTSGRVVHASSGRILRYGEIAADAANESVPSWPRLKARKDYKLVGTSPPRLDIPEKVTGGMIYGIDVRLPDMRYAAVAHAPVHGGKLAAVDPAPAFGVSGVERVVKTANAVAVVARRYWQATKGLEALAPRFDDGGNGAVSTASIYEQQHKALREVEAEIVHATGNADAVLAKGGVIEANYQVPFLHHAPVEPINATAQFKDGTFTFWGGQQEPLAAKSELAALAGLSVDDVAIVPMPIGGAFGRRLSNATNYLPALVRIAMESAPHPVKMIWGRDEDFAQGAYRPQLTSWLRARLGPDGLPQAWWQRYVNAPTRSGGFRIPYAIPHQSIAFVEAPHHVRRGSWRGVAHSQHGFWTECFIDELANAAGRDPYEYRRALLPKNSRERRVLDVAAEKAGWGKPLPAGVGRGIAVVESYGSVVAEVVDVALDGGGVPRPLSVVVAVDCGRVIHPDNGIAQVEGSVIMGLSAATREQITIEKGAVVEKTFLDYPVFRLVDAPLSIDVHFVESDGPLGGLGEPALPPVAPALANALFKLTGKRNYRLPLAPPTPL